MPPFDVVMIAVAQGLVHVAAYPINHGTRDTAQARVLGHDVAPYRAIGSAIVVDDNNVTFSDVVNEVTDRSRRHACWNVLDREGRPDHNPGVVCKRCNAKRLTVNARLVERV